MLFVFFFFKQKTAYEIYQCDWSSDCALPICGRCVRVQEINEPDRSAVPELSDIRQFGPEAVGCTTASFAHPGERASVHT